MYIFSYRFDYNERLLFIPNSIFLFIFIVVVTNQAAVVSPTAILNLLGIVPLKFYYLSNVGPDYD